MKDNNQNLNDAVASMAVDIEEIKNKLQTLCKSGNKEEPQLDVRKLNRLLLSTDDSTMKMLNSVFGSQDKLDAFRKSIAFAYYELASEQLEDSERKVKEQGGQTTFEIFKNMQAQLNQILVALQSTGSKEQLSPSVKKNGFVRWSWVKINCSKVLGWWSKSARSWWTSPQGVFSYTIGFIVFGFIILCIVEMQRVREENSRLNAIEERYQVQQAILNELAPKLSITINGYSRMVNIVGADSTMTIFKEQLKVLDKSKR